MSKDHEERINSVLARKALKHGYRQEAVTHEAPLTELIAAEEQAAAAAGLGRGDVLKRMLQFFYADGQHPGAVVRRVFAVAKAIDPDLLGHMTLEDVGEMLGETKAAQSWRVKKIFSGYQKQAGARGFKASFQKSEDACVAMSRAQRGNKNRSGKRKNAE